MREAEGWKGARLAAPCCLAAWTATPYYVAGYGLVDSALRVMTQSSGIDKNAVPPLQILTVANSSAVTVPYNAPLNALQQYMRIWKR